MELKMRNRKVKFNEFLIKICLVLGLVLLLCGDNSQGFSTQYRGNTKHSTIPEHCFYEEMQLSVPRNGTVFPTDVDGYCVRVHCREDYVLMIKHCDRVQVPYGCKMTLADSTQAYPRCCPILVCGAN